MLSGVCTVQLMQDEQKGWIAGTVDGQCHLFHDLCDERTSCRLTWNAHDSTVWTLRALNDDTTTWITGGGDGALKLHLCEHDSGGNFIQTLDTQSLASSAVCAIDRLASHQNTAYDYMAAVSFNRKLYAIQYVQQHGEHMA
jgi:hypothetical protein